MGSDTVFLDLVIAMPTAFKSIARIVSFTTVIAAAASPVVAQTDLAGSWSSLQHEDALERAMAHWIVAAGSVAGGNAAFRRSKFAIVSSSGLYSHS